MPVRFYLGKGLHESVPPYRDAWFFGAELNTVEADGWNGVPIIRGETSHFDLSSITINHEVCVAFIKITSARSGLNYFKMKWYRVRDNKLLFTYDWNYRTVSGGWCYCYSYIGWVDWEINENGEYYVVAEVSGANPYSASKYFTISGITEEPEPEPPPAGTMGWISQRFADASEALYLAYLNVLGISFVGETLAVPFLWLARICADLSWDFYYFNEVVNHIIDRIADILNFSDIYSYFETYFNYAVTAWSWVRNAWDNIKGAVGDLIDIAKQGLEGLIDIATAGLDSLRVEWDNFWTVTFPTLVSFDWLGIWWNDQLIELDFWFRSELQELAPFWEGWQEARDKVIDFFNDPLQWFYDRLEEFFDRYW